MPISLPEMSMNKSPKSRAFFSTLRLQRLEKAMKNIQGLDQYGGMDYEDLYFLPNIKFPHKLKMPDFAKYDGTGDPTSQGVLRRVRAIWQ